MDSSVSIPITRHASVVVSEIFGPTVQGEGPNVGRRCAFVRLGLCNLSCSWCDTPYTWDWSRYDRKAETRRVEIPEILDIVGAMKVRRVVITGGEPLVQVRRLGTLITALSLAGYAVEVETNGTILPGGEMLKLAHWNVSPKLAHAGMTIDDRISWEVLDAFLAAPSAAFKFVCVTPEDLQEVALICAMADIPPHRVWIMPEGRSANDVRDHLRDIAEAAIEREYNLSPRLHVDVWGDARAH